MLRVDPIQKRYFDAVILAESASNWLFYVGALVSIATVFVDKLSFPNAYDWVLLVFAVIVVAYFVVGIILRLYLIPRADDARRRDFFTSACGVDLTHIKTVGYYNNNFTEPIKRMAAQVLENSLFSKAIILRMVRLERYKIVAYVVVWLICVLYRRTDLGYVVVASQAVFSEQVVSKYIRLEWLRIRFEKTFDDTYKLFQALPSKPQFSAMTLDALSSYETAKSNAAITLSSKIFEELNPSLSLEWEAIKKSLKI
jgi:hypothetical protein